MRSKWEREGAIVAGLLVKEIRRAQTWQDIINAGDALFHLRLMQKGLEPHLSTEAISKTEEE